MANLLGVISIVCLLVAVIMLINLIQRAFDRDGVLWGLISIVYPPGTYMFCRKDWDSYRKPFITISVLLGISLVVWIVLKLAT